MILQDSYSGGKEKHSGRGLVQQKWKLINEPKKNKVSLGRGLGCLVVDPVLGVGCLEAQVRALLGDVV